MKITLIEIVNVICVLAALTNNVKHQKEYSLNTFYTFYLNHCLSAEPVNCVMRSFIEIPSLSSFYPLHIAVTNIGISTLLLNF